MFICISGVTTQYSNIILINGNITPLTYDHICTCVFVFLISSYGAPLAHRVSYLALAQFSLWASGAVNYDYIVSNSIKS